MESKNTPAVGLGTINSSIRVYIENTPPLPEYEYLSSVRALTKGDIANIAQLTGNHWRKIFNVYAKLLFELNPKHFQTWQELREQYLLQDKSNENLLFSGITFQEISQENEINTAPIHIIMGKTYAKKLALDEECFWLSESFAINASKNLIICPYFDYRQLSNIKIIQLSQLIKQIQSGETLKTN